MGFLNTAFYRFVRLEDLAALRAIFREKCESLALRGTVLLSPEGINGFLAGTESAIRAFQDFLESQPNFRGIEHKESWSDSIPFGRLRIKLKKEIITMGRPEIQPALQTGSRLGAAELKRWLDEKRDVLLVDTRNDYEVDAGTFDGALTLGLKNFREFPEKLKAIPTDARKRPVVMFCTGGIRCEKATALAQNEGFEQVFQLEGGILKYFEECGAAHYRGTCFVFDERVALDGTLTPRTTSGN